MRFLFILALLSNLVFASNLTNIAYDCSPSILLISHTEEGGKTTIGTGFYISNCGQVVTNYHVIHNARNLEVTNNKGNKLQVLGIQAIDPASDIAIIQVRSCYNPFLRLSSIDNIQLYTPYVAIGHVLNKGRVYSTGSINRIRDLPRGSIWLQFTGKIYKGFSGGPLITSEGTVAGIVTRKIQGDTEFNYAISSNDILHCLNLAKINPIIDIKDYQYPDIDIDILGLTDEQHPLVWADAAKTYYELGQLDQAYRAAERSLAIDPKCISAIEVLILYYNSKGDTVNADYYRSMLKPF